MYGKIVTHINLVNKVKDKMTIAAIRSISLSEIYKVNKIFSEKYVQENPTRIINLLWELGINTKEYYEQQVNTHRNIFSEVYTGSRFVGLERTDKEWLDSGYASREAKDKATGNKLLNDLYRNKGLSEDRLAGVWQD